MLKKLIPGAEPLPPEAGLRSPFSEAGGNNRPRPFLSFPLIVLALVAFAVITRFHALADKPLHHDESLFAYYSYFLAKGFGYEYQPILHGPILEHVTALVFVLFGDSDFTMRLPAVVGSLGLFVVAWYWRRYLGKAGTIAAILLLALSPSITYYSRFLRNDAPYLAATAWCALCTVRAVHTGQRRYFWAAILSATVMFCMMESSIFFFAACIGFLVIACCADFLRGLFVPAEARRRFPGNAVFFVPSVRGETATHWRDLAVVGTGISAALLLSAGAAWAYARIFSDSLPLPLLAREAAGSSSPPLWKQALAAFPLLLPLAVIPCLVAAVNWRTPRGERGALHYFLRVCWLNRWAILGATAAGVAIFTTLFTTWFTHTEGPDFRGNRVPWTPVQIYKNTWDYWWDQHKLHRIKGPFHYYLPILLTYELPSVLIVLWGWMRSLLSRNRWIHLAALALPHLVLAAVYFGFLQSRMDWDFMDGKFHLTSPGHLFLLLFFVQILTHATGAFLTRGAFVEAFLTFWTVTSLFAYSYAGEKVPWLTIHTAGPLAILAGYYIMRTSRETRWTRARAALAGIAVFVAVVWQFRNEMFVNFVTPWSPAERLVYNHTSPDVVRAVRQIEEVAQASGYGKTLPMVIKGEMEWPLYWYLRKYTDWAPSAGENAETTSRPVVLVNWEAAYPANLVQNYEIQRLKVREWWEPPLLDLAAMTDIWRLLTPLESRRSGENPTRLMAAQFEWRKLWRFLAYREIWLDPMNAAFSNGTNEFALCIRKDFLRQITTYEWHNRMPMRRDIPVYP